MKKIFIFSIMCLFAMCFCSCDSDNVDEPKLNHVVHAEDLIGTWVIETQDFDWLNNAIITIPNNSTIKNETREGEHYELITGDNMLLSNIKQVGRWTNQSMKIDEVTVANYKDWQTAIIDSTYHYKNTISFEFTWTNPTTGYQAGYQHMNFKVLEFNKNKNETNILVELWYVHNMVYIGWQRLLPQVGKNEPLYKFNLKKIS